MAISNTIPFSAKPTGSVLPKQSFGVQTTTPSTTKPLATSSTPVASLNLGSGGLAALPGTTMMQSPTSTGGTQGLAPTNFGTSSYTNSNPPITPTPAIPPPTLPTPVTSPTPKPQGLFPSIVSSLAGRGTSQNTAAQNYTKRSMEYGAGAIPIAAQARDIADQYGRKIADIGQLGAGAVAGDLSTGTNVVGSGNAAIASQSASQRMSALAAGQQAALQGIGYQLTGQQQAQQAANAAAGQEYAGQGLQQSALSSAAGYAAPATAAYGQTVFNPLTGQYEGGAGNLDPQTPAPNLAQRVMSGQMTYDQAVASMGYAGNAGRTFLDNALTQAGGNPLQLQASGAAQQGVMGTQTQQVEGYRSALQQGKNLQSQLTNLIQSFGLNPSDLNAVNSGLQKIAQNTSSPQYKLLSNYVNDIANTYSQILTPPGGSSTDMTRSIATSMLDATASGTSIITVMEGLDNAAQAKIAGVSTIGGGTSGSNASLPSGGIDWNSLGD